MGNPFGFNSPLMNFMRKVVDFMLLNFLAVICSLPIFTAGAAISAVHDVCVKLRKGDCAVTTSFLKAFKDNLKNATLLWLILLGCAVFIFFDYQLAKTVETKMQSIVQVVLVVECVIVLMAYSWIFPLQARYENKTFHTIKNALILTIAYLQTTILMMIMTALPIVMFFLSEYTLPLVLLLGYVMPIYWNTGLYTKILDSIDEKNRQ